MAKPPVASAAPMDQPDAPAPTDDATSGMDEAAPDEEAADDSEVLLTVCKEADGTYSLIKGDEEEADGTDAGDEEEADGTDAAGAADTAGTPEEANKQTFDSPGALLKAILDILNEDKSSEGAEGGSEDQFQAGFGGAADGAPAAPTTAMPQKY